MKRTYLIERRKELGLKQEEVANMIGISRSFYTQIELGTRNPTLQLCRKIADALNIDSTLFLAESVADRNNETLQSEKGSED